MHTCPPPIAQLNNWLEEHSSINGNYGHLLLEQKCECNPSILDAMRQYFESAHLDAREYFHAAIGIDLHPDADAEDDALTRATLIVCLIQLAVGFLAR